ncbi:unnamed protein product, partial [Ilex paraguariensis]
MAVGSSRSRRKRFWLVRASRQGEMACRTQARRSERGHRQMELSSCSGSRSVKPLGPRRREADLGRRERRERRRTGGSEQG